MAGALAAAGHDVTLACGRYQGAVTGLTGGFRQGAREGRVAGFRVREYDIACGNAQGLRARSLAFLRFAAATARLALARRFDVVLASSTPLTVAVPALLARWLRGTPFVFEIRDPWPELPRALSAGGAGVPGSVLAAMERLADAACRRAALVVALTDGMAETAAARGAARIAVLPQGADPAMADAVPWRPAGLAGRLLAIHAGAMGRANGLDLLLDAAGLLRGDGVTVLLVGEGSEAARLAARIARENLPALLLPPMPKVRLAGLLAGCDIGLLCLAPVPEFAEWTAPNKLVEGLAAGLPMVTNVPGRAARLLGSAGAGIAAPPGDAAGLADALRALAADAPRRRAMGAAGRALAAQNFDARAIGARLVPLIEAAACH
jgi:glycosyltransferase involved in cell wall biosynthesis